jgi:hypothetical protein
MNIRKKNWKRESLEKNANYSGSQREYNGSVQGTLQRHCTENSKQIFPVMKLRGLVPNFHIHVLCERFIYSHNQSFYFAAEKRRADRGSINCSQIHECGNWE